MPAQTSIQRRPGQGRIDELTHRHEQVVQRYERQPTNLSDADRLPLAERGAELVRKARSIRRVVAGLPFGHRGAADVVVLRQLNHSEFGGSNFGADQGRRAGSVVDLTRAGKLASLGSALRLRNSSRIRSLALNNAQLRRGTRSHGMQQVGAISAYRVQVHPRVQERPCAGDGRTHVGAPPGLPHATKLLQT